MQPIYNELIKMWSDLGYDIPISEGTFWLDNGIIKAFTADGVLHKLYKYKVNDDLTIQITKHKDNKDTELIFETWNETLQRNILRLDELEKESLNLISTFFEDNPDYEKYVLTSTGKDSMVTLDLVKRVLPNVNVVFNNTSLDTADTYKMVKSHPDWIILNPKEGFWQWTKRLDFIPTRYSRACCSIFKEGLGDTYYLNKDIKKLCLIMGIRNDESNKRADREDFSRSPKWNNKRCKDWISMYPIRKYSDLDVWLYILRYNVEINIEYKRGFKRVGCIVACPFCSKSTWVLDKYWYPNLFKRWHNHLEETFKKTNGWFGWNCSIQEFHSCWNGGQIRKNPTDEIIKELMEYKGLTDEAVAKQYFNKVCANDGKNIRQKDILAMNMKLFGRNIEKFKCKKCLMKEMNWTKEDWNKQVEGFKLQGCKLF